MEFDLVGTDEVNVESEDPFVGNFDSIRKGSIQDSSFSGESKREKAERIIREMESSYQKLNHLLIIITIGQEM